MIGQIKKMYGQIAVSATARRTTRTSVGNARLALTGTDWSWAASQLQARGHRSLNHFMRTKIALSLCIILGAGFSAFGGADNPAQAAARKALEQKLQQPNAWEPQPLTEAASLPSVAMAEPAGKSAAGVARTAAVRTTAPQTVPVSKARAASPIPAAPAVAASATVEPAAVAPDVVAPTTIASDLAASATVAPAVKARVASTLMVSFFVASLLVVMVLLLKLRQMKLKLRELDSRY
jgi:hypothetical protein